MRVSLRGGDADRVTSCCATVERKQNKVTSCCATCVSDRSHSGRSIFFSIMLRAICRLLFVEARCFYEHRGDERAKTNSHIGTHPIIMQGISEHTQFAPMLKECARQLREWVVMGTGLWPLFFAGPARKGALRLQRFWRLRCWSAACSAAAVARSSISTSGIGGGTRVRAYAMSAGISWTQTSGGAQILQTLSASSVRLETGRWAFARFPQPQRGVSRCRPS